jgi:hypothetical protein
MMSSQSWCKDFGLIKANKVFGVMGMLKDNRFSEEIMKIINDMFFEMGLDGSTSLANVGFSM